MSDNTQMVELSEAGTQGRLTRLIGGYTKRPWLIEPDKFNSIIEVVRSENLLRGSTAIEDERPERYSGLGERIDVSGGGSYTRLDSVALIPVSGTIFPRSNLMTAYSGMTSAQSVLNSVISCTEDSKIGTILFDVDSPGGYVLGVPECADGIYEARKKVRIVAHVSEAYSAAYYLASQCDEVVCTRSGGVGSVGVLTIHKSVAEQNKQAGVEITIIKKPQFKAEGNPFEKLSESAKRHIQGEIDSAYDDFVAAVARGRNISTEEVKEKYGKGRIVSAGEALELGMIDRIEAWNDTLARVKSESDNRRSESKRGRSMAEPNDAVENTALAELQAQVATMSENMQALNEESAENKTRAEAAETSLAEQVKKTANMETELAYEKRTRAEADAKQFVESLDALTLSPEAHAPMFVRMRESMSTEDVEVVENVLKAANEAASQSGIFKEQANNKAVPAGEGDSNQQLFDQAQVLVDDGKHETVGAALAFLTNPLKNPSKKTAELIKRNVQNRHEALLTSGNQE